MRDSDIQFPLVDFVVAKEEGRESERETEKKGANSSYITMHAAAASLTSRRRVGKTSIAMDLKALGV